MSSHHFVKDGQEPALIIANGAACRREILDQLLEWCPFVLVLDGALQRVLDLGIAFNVISGDFDSEPNVHDKLKDRPNIEIIHTPDQNFTDLQKGINICQMRNYTHIHVLWATGERTDHSLINLDTIIRHYPITKIVFWDNWHKIFAVSSGFKKWYKKDTFISIIPWPFANNVCALNLQWPLNNLPLAMGKQLSTSNAVAENGFLEIVFDKGNLLLMEGIV